MDTFTLTGGATVEVAPITYLKDLQRLSLFNIGDKNRAVIAKKINVTADMVGGLISDYCLVSIYVTTNHPISEYLAEPTNEDSVFLDDMNGFLEALTREDYALAFEEILQGLLKILKERNRHKLPEKPDDPNL